LSIDLRCQAQPRGTEGRHSPGHSRLRWRSLDPNKPPAEVIALVSLTGLRPTCSAAASRGAVPACSQRTSNGRCSTRALRGEPIRRDRMKPRWVMRSPGSATTWVDPLGANAYCARLVNLTPALLSSQPVNTQRESRRSSDSRRCHRRARAMSTFYGPRQRWIGVVDPPAVHVHGAPVRLWQADRHRHRQARRSRYLPSRERVEGEDLSRQQDRVWFPRRR